MPRSFLILGAEPPWIYPLASELSALGPAAAVSLGSSSSLIRRTVRWPFDDAGGSLQHEIWTYPPGFNGSLAPAFDRLIRARLNALCDRLKQQSGADPWVIVPYPPFAAYVADVDTSRLVYWNYDDYSTGETAIRGETELMRRAGTVLCSSAHQTAKFEDALGDRRRDVFHFPHGVHPAFLNADPAAAPAERTVCSVGALTGRYDWPLIREVAAALPDVQFSFIGELASGQALGAPETWESQCAETLKMPNVRHIPGVRHRDTRTHYWTSAASWMPYNTALPFVQACCPLKLTDGLASGRPIVSADVPECRRYPEWISIYQDAPGATAALTSALERAAVPGRAAEQIAFASAETWPARAGRLVQILERNPR